VRGAGSNLRPYRDQRGHHYGTIVVDLERREPIAVFAGREVVAVTAWRREHPSIRIVARDRAGAYSEAVRTALPAAKQVSDRWHLLCNLRDNVQRVLHRLGQQLRQAAQRVVVGVTLVVGRRAAFPCGDGKRLSDDRRAARLALYEKVMALRAQGSLDEGHRA
jgi:Transposase